MIIGYSEKGEDDDDNERCKILITIIIWVFEEEEKSCKFFFRCKTLSEKSRITILGENNIGDVFSAEEFNISLLLMGLCHYIIDIWKGQLMP